MDQDTDMRTPLGRVRGFGSARSGTEDFWYERLTAVALVPLTAAVILIVMSLLGRNHAAVVQILGSPIVAIIMLLFVLTTAYHMKLGMQVVIEDYVHDEAMKYTLLIGNLFFCVVVALAASFAILKLSFGV
ncbi:MAG: succinate dehydrogenase, hydrophobic membrane anchor protein [Bradyrhizobiaceae bacterium]|nr:succinate dehydrogenase, hydrophobic membrane anchor protein [Bradyrhizobiaceae bacterium]